MGRGLLKSIIFTFVLPEEVSGLVTLCVPSLFAVTNGKAAQKKKDRGW